MTRTGSPPRSAAGWLAGRLAPAQRPLEGVDWLDGLVLDGETIRSNTAPGVGKLRLFAALLLEEQVLIEPAGK